MSFQNSEMFEELIEKPDEITTDFYEFFEVEKKEYACVDHARRDALKFGKKINVAFVTTNSSKSRQTLLLSCKHGKTLRKGTSNVSTAPAPSDSAEKKNIVRILKDPIVLVM